jgi:hypothetical protein
MGLLTLANGVVHIKRHALHSGLGSTPAPLSRPYECFSDCCGFAARAMKPADHVHMATLLEQSSTTSPPHPQHSLLHPGDPANWDCKWSDSRLCGGNTSATYNDMSSAATCTVSGNTAFLSPSFLQFQLFSWGPAFLALGSIAESSFPTPLCDYCCCLLFFTAEGISLYPHCFANVSRVLFLLCSNRLDLSIFRALSYHLSSNILATSSWHLLPMSPADEASPTSLSPATACPKHPTNERAAFDLTPPQN